MLKLPRRAVVLFAYIKLLFCPGWLMPKPIYTACALLVLAGILILSVVNSLQDATPVPNSNYAVLSEKRPEQAEPPEEPIVIIQPEAANIKSPGAPIVSAAKTIPARPSNNYDQETPRWPVQGQIINNFGWQQHPIYKDWRYHNGIDIETAQSQPVQAVIGGVAEEIYNDKNYGQTVVVRSGRYKIIYGSLGSVAVNNNDVIENGAKIGTTGSYPVEPQIHLHLAIKGGDKFIDPHSLLK